MEPKRKKNNDAWSYKFTWTLPSDNWIDKMDHTHFEMIALDILEVDVEDSKNKEAKQMLESIGIKC